MFYKGVQKFRKNSKKNQSFDKPKKSVKNNESNVEIPLSNQIPKKSNICENCQAYQKIIQLQKIEISKLYSIIEKLSNDLENKEKFIEANFKYEVDESAHALRFNEHDESLYVNTSRAKPQPKKPLYGEINEDISEEIMFESESTQEQNIFWKAMKKKCPLFEDENVKMSLEKENSKTRDLFSLVFKIKNKLEKNITECLILMTHAQGN